MTHYTLKFRGIYKQFWRFSVVGAVGFIVNAGIVEFLKSSIGPLFAQILAFPVAATVTWWLNRRYTFGASQRAAHHEWLRYFFANLLGWAINNGVYVWFVLHSGAAYRHPSLAVAAGSIAGMFLNFSFSRFIVFQRM